MEKIYKLFDWGGSMYGGYYATIRRVGSSDYIGLHAEKLNELRAELKRYGIDRLEESRRFDN